MTEAESLRATNETLNREVQSLRKELAEVKQTSQKYLQNVAHQLTAPLGAIKWSIEALKNEKVPIQRKRQLLSSIYGQATILVHLIKNFTLMSSLEADLELGQFREKPEPVDALGLAINLASDFQPQAADLHKKIFVYDDSFHETFAGRCLSIEKNLVAQAISNILENAIKYSDGDTVIELRAQRTPATVEVSVTSCGIPLRTDEIPRLTERGFRGQPARQRVPAGTGIGLYLANRVMQLHQGAIKVKADGFRSTFTLAFPLGRLV